MHETLAREHTDLPGFPVCSSMLCGRSDIGLTLAHKDLIGLLGEGIAIVDDLASPSIYSRQFLNPELVPGLCEDMVAHVVRLVCACRKGDEHGDALGLVGIE